MHVGFVPSHKGQEGHARPIQPHESGQVSEMPFFPTISRHVDVIFCEDKKRRTWPFEMSHRGLSGTNLIMTNCNQVDDGAIGRRKATKPR